MENKAEIVVKVFYVNPRAVYEGAGGSVTRRHRHLLNSTCVNPATLLSSALQADIQMVAH